MNNRRHQDYFAGKTVWITGASSGIGAAICRELDDCGAHLVLSARRESELDEVRRSCLNPQRHRVVPLDLSDVTSIEAAVHTVLTGGAPVDVLVNNAGISQRASAMETERSVMERILAVNLGGTVALTKCVLPGMIERHSGQVVVISSVLGRIGVPMRSAYAASKHALHGYFESMRAEIYDQGVRISIVCPGYVATDISFNALTGQGHANGKQSDGHATAMSPVRCAHLILKSVSQQKAEVTIGGREVWGVWLFRWWPTLYRWLIRRITPRS